MVRCPGGVRIPRRHAAHDRQADSGTARVHLPRRQAARTPFRKADLGKAAHLLHALSPLTLFSGDLLEALRDNERDAAYKSVQS